MKGQVVVDLEAEEADDAALRQVMLWRPLRSHGGSSGGDDPIVEEEGGAQGGVSLRRLLALEGPWTGTAEEVSRMVGSERAPAMLLFPLHTLINTFLPSFECDNTGRDRPGRRRGGGHRHGRPYRS